VEVKEMTRFLRQFCPECWHRVDTLRILETSKAPPAEGDFTLCIHCAAVLVWGEGMRLRLPDQLEAAIAGENQTIGLLQASIIRTIRHQEQ
jgi:hypothetical protein